MRRVTTETSRSPVADASPERQHSIEELDAQALIEQARAHQRRRRRKQAVVAGVVAAIALIASSLWRVAPWNWWSGGSSVSIPVSTEWHTAGPALWLHGEPGNYLGFGPSTLLTCTSALGMCFAVVQANGIGLNGRAAVPGVSPGLSPAQSSLFRSTDAGRSWERFALPKDTWLSTPLSCPTEHTCFAGALRGVVESPGSTGVAVLLKTEDGGSHWSTQPLPSRVGLVVAVSCPSSSRCMSLTWDHDPEVIAGIQPASGVSRFFPTDVLATANAGSTWYSLDVPGLTAGRSAQISNLVCPDIQTCYVEADEATIVSSNGGYNPQGHVTTVYRTTRGSGPLVPTVTEANQAWDPIACPTSASCLAVVATGLGPIRMQRFGTAKATEFVTRGLPSDFDPGALICPTTSRCVMSGWGGLLYSSTDSGHTWSKSPIASTTTGSRQIYVVANLACDKSFRCLGLTDGPTDQSRYASAAVTTKTITNIP